MLRGRSEPLLAFEPLSPEEYEKHLAEVLPNAADVAEVRDLMHEPGWIAPRDAVGALSS